MIGPGPARLRRPAPHGEAAAPLALGAAALALGGGASLAGLAGRPVRRSPRRAPGRRSSSRAGQRREARGLYAAAALLALAVLCDSGVEHDRGRFRNPGMFTPLIVSGAAALTAVREARSLRPQRAGGLVFVSALAVGVGGLGFHLYNLGKRPGRLSWHNLFYAAPLGAPAALSLGGLLGLLAQAVAQGRERILGWRAGRLVSAVAAFGIAGTAAEATLFHFRGAFQNPFMWAPVSLPPISAALLARAAAEPEPHPSPWARACLAATVALGAVGVGFHAFGISRAMGGWRNWRQNILDGPPLPAPPAFSALALAGLCGLALREREAGR